MNWQHPNYYRFMEANPAFIIDREDKQAAAIRRKLRRLRLIQRAAGILLAAVLLAGCFALACMAFAQYI